MTATAAEILQVRRMVAEPTTTTYSDVLIQGFIEKWPLMDELGTEPYYWVTSGGSAPTKVENDTWYPTYDLNAAAADIWDEKAAAAAANYDFRADGGDYTSSQAYQHAVSMARYFRSKRSMRVTTLIKKPDEPNRTYAPWIINAPEPRD